MQQSERLPGSHTGAPLSLPTQLYGRSQEHPLGKLRVSQQHAHIQHAVKHASSLEQHASQPPLQFSFHSSLPIPMPFSLPYNSLVRAACQSPWPLAYRPQLRSPFLRHIFRSSPIRQPPCLWCAEQAFELSHKEPLPKHEERLHRQPDKSRLASRRPEQKLEGPGNALAAARAPQTTASSLLLSSSLPPSTALSRIPFALRDESALRPRGH